jgi:hypothetical protein
LPCFLYIYYAIKQARKRILGGHMTARKHAGGANSNAGTIDAPRLVAWFRHLGATAGEYVPLQQRIRTRVNGCRIATYKTKHSTLLPSHFTWAQLRQQYAISAELEDEPVKVPSITAFKRILGKHCPNTAIRSPRSNVCDTCLKFKHTEMPTGSAEETESFASHVNDATSMRGLYNKDLAEAKGSNHVIVMDYAQNMTLPHTPQTPSAWYFLSLWSVSLFGLFYGNEKSQYNYLYSERKGGKGSNEVISMVLNFLTSKSMDKPSASTRTLTVYADNCGGQNKNNNVIKFFLLLVDYSVFKVYLDIRLYY